MKKKVSGLKKPIFGLAIFGVVIALIYFSSSGMAPNLGLESLLLASASGEKMQVNSNMSAKPLEKDAVGGGNFNTRLLDFYRMKDEAEQGDAGAQRDLASIYEKCMGYSLSPDRYIGMLDAISAQAPSERIAIESVKRRLVADCSVVDDGAKIPLEAYELWLNAAAKSGDLVAKVRLAARSMNRVPADEVKALADEAVASGSPEALFELGELLRRVSEDADLGSYEQISGPGYRSYGWGIVACKMGKACGAGSDVMDSLCLNTGSCSYSNYEDFVRNELTTVGDKRKLDKAIESVERTVGYPRL